MQAALQEFIVHGVVTNIDFLQAVLSHPDFVNGQVTTRWVENNLESDSSSHSQGVLLRTQEQVPAFHMIAASLADLTIDNRKLEISNESDPYSPWKAASGFRMGRSNE